MVKQEDIDFWLVHVIACFILRRLLVLGPRVWSVFLVTNTLNGYRDPFHGFDMFRILLCRYKKKARSARTCFGYCMEAK